MTQAKAKVVILFADMSGSSRLYDALGNTDAQTLVSSCLEILTDVTSTYRGRVLKTIGDEVMCLFPTVVDAARAASDMHLSVRRAYDPDDLPFGRIQIRVGMHYGEVLEEGDDLYGETVILAGRMCRSAKPDQILTTEATVEALPEELGAAVRYVDEETIRGPLDKMHLYELIWELSDLTDIAEESPRGLRKTHSILALECNGQSYELSRERPSLAIGRSRQNDVVFPNALTSRNHARIELRRGRFVLCDESVNGTIVVREDGKTISLIRDEYALDGQGRIGMGAPPDTNPELSIEYKCIE